MVSRRTLLQFGAGMLAATAGCLGGQPSDPGTPDDGTATPRDWTDTPRAGESTASTETEHDVPTRTPGDVPEWEPAWTVPFEGWTVLGLEAVDGVLFVTLSTDTGRSAVAAVDPDERDVRWRTDAAGEAVAGSHAADRRNARGQWGVTVGRERVYAVAGQVDARRWSAIHALDRASGEQVWSIRRERELGVAGLADGLVVATGLEFFPPGGTPGPDGETPTPGPTHTTPESPLSTVVYGLDAAEGSVRWTREYEAVRDVSVGTGGVYVAAGDRLVGLALDGTQRFAYRQGPATRVRAGDGWLVYLTGEDETATLHGLAPSGDREWRHRLPVRELLLDGRRLYAGGGTVAGLTADGGVVWRHDDPGRWLLLAPGRERLYARSGVRMDGAMAYDVDAGPQWRFDPPSNNAWPAAATDDAVTVESINGGGGPFKRLYAVDADGNATAALGRETVFDALGLDGRIYLADGVSNLVALEA